MPCGHNFCKGCLDKRFAEQEAAKGGSKALAEAQAARSLRVRKVRPGSARHAVLPSASMLCSASIVHTDAALLPSCAAALLPFLLYKLCVALLTGTCCACSIPSPLAGAQALPHLQNRHC